MRRIPTTKRSLEKAPVRLKGEEHEGESNVMVGVDQGAVDAPLGDHAADIAAVGDATGVEGRILSRFPGEPQVAAFDGAFFLQEAEGTTDIWRIERSIGFEES